MSPELERLLNAMFERDTCEPPERPKWNATVHQLIEEACMKLPGLSREEFLNAVKDRYLDFRRARRNPPSPPPRA